MGEIMQNMNEYYKNSMSRIQQLKNQKELERRRNLEAKRKTDILRHIVIGELVCKHFPEMMQYQPQRNRSDTAKEFLDFENLLQTLATDTEFLDYLKGKTHIS